MGSPVRLLQRMRWEAALPIMRVRLWALGLRNVAKPARRYSFPARAIPGRAFPTARSRTPMATANLRATSASLSAAMKTNHWAAATMAVVMEPALEFGPAKTTRLTLGFGPANRHVPNPTRVKLREWLPRNA